MIENSDSRCLLGDEICFEDNNNNIYQYSIKVTSEFAVFLCI